MALAHIAKSRFSPRQSSSAWFVGAVVVVIGCGLIVLAAWNSGTLAWMQRAAESKLTLADIPVNGERAFGYLKQICDIGPRISGTAGMQRQQELLKTHFESLGGRVTMQEFQARHPLDGSRVPLANMLVEWHPEKKERVLLCCHYDTRPLPDQDPVNPKGVFIGANDGASGAALLMELAHEVPSLKCRYGVDFLLFDGEELVYDGNRDPYFLGSEHFARQYVASPPAHKYRCAVLVDMIGDAQLQIFREVNSMKTIPTRQLVGDIWGVARSLGVKEFVAVTRYEVRDDHLALNNIARIPSIDIIDFEYPRARGENYWHTTKDVPENCSALSLAKVGWVLKTWLERVR
jgi:hypothetical protein